MLPLAIFFVIVIVCCDPFEIEDIVPVCSPRYLFLNDSINLTSMLFAVSVPLLCTVTFIFSVAEVSTTEISDDVISKSDEGPAGWTSTGIVLTVFNPSFVAVIVHPNNPTKFVGGVIVKVEPDIPNELPATLQVPDEGPNVCPFENCDNWILIIWFCCMSCFGTLKYGAVGSSLNAILSIQLPPEQYTLPWPNKNPLPEEIKFTSVKDMFVEIPWVISG